MSLYTVVFIKMSLGFNKGVSCQLFPALKLTFTFPNALAASCPHDVSLLATEAGRGGPEVSAEVLSSVALGVQADFSPKGRWRDQTGTTSPGTRAGGKGDRVVWSTVGMARAVSGQAGGLGTVAAHCHLLKHCAGLVRRGPLFPDGWIPIPGSDGGPK